MNERTTLAIVGIMGLALIVAGFISYLGHAGEGKEIAMMVVSGLAGAIGGHAAKAATTTTGDINVDEGGK